MADPNNPAPLETPAPAAVPAAQPAVAPAPIRIPDPNRPGGFKEYASTDDLIKAKEAADEHIRKLEAEAAEWRKKTEQVQAVVTGTPVAPTQQFDADTYFRLLAEDPMKAYTYQRGFDPEWNALRQQTAQTRLQNVVQTFFAQHPDVPQTEQSFNEILDVAGKLGYSEATISPQQLGAAAVYAKYLKERQAQAQPAAQPAQPGAPVPPPRLPIAATPETPGEQKIAAEIAAAPTRAAADEVARKYGLIP